jgi:2-dehydropantoate 2-reductase
VGKMDKTRILVIGAGVNGSICAAALFRAGIDVTVLARGKRYEELQGEGIVIENLLTKARDVVKVPVIVALESEDVYDYALVVVHRHQVKDLLPALARNRSPNIVFMVNNPSGPDEFISAIGKERVMLGFVFAGGKREGSIVRAISGNIGGVLGKLFGGGTPFGEIDGAISPRLVRLVDILNRAGLKSRISSDVSDYLATHAAIVALPIMLFAKYGGNKHTLARADSDLRLLVDAWREALAVLNALGYRIVPPRFLVVKAIPRFIMLAMLRAFINSRMWDLATTDMSGDWSELSHSQTFEEFRFIAKEFGRLTEKTGIPAPSLRQLLTLVQ